MSESKRYFNAMIAGQDYICSRIEQDHDLYGYPPEIVSVGLKAFDEGKSVQDAVAAYLDRNDDEDDQPEACPECDGDGMDPGNDYVTPCPHCDGDGQP